MLAKPKFGLNLETPAAWVRQVEALGVNELLSDHAHCELKAAATMQALVAKNCDHALIVEKLPPIAIEELEHFQLVERELRKRGGELREQTSSPYADGLQKGSARTRSSLLLDRLLISHLIEARSAERFHLLATHLEDRELARLYQDLMPSESAHRVLFQRLALSIFSESQVTERLETLRTLEAQVIAQVPVEPRVHSGFRP